MSDLSDAKSRIRSALLERRSLLSREEKLNSAQDLIFQVLQNGELSQALHVGLYWSFNHEISTQALFQKLRSQGKTLYLPRVKPESREMEFVAISDTGQMFPNVYGVLEPEPHLAPVDRDRLDVILVPGVAFDIRGNRMGWGKGYYDRFLTGYAGLILGLAYDFQVLDSIPFEKWDVPVKAIATDKRYMVCP